VKEKNELIIFGVYFRNFVMGYSLVVFVIF